jgi:peptidoglycan glycosyltransferase
MKQMRRAIRAIATLLIVSFLGLGGWLGYTVYSQGSRWTTSQLNSRLGVAKKTNAMGDITDRSGMVLATTGSDRTRKYNDNKTIRRAVSQTVGDAMGMSGTGVETFHAGTLLGLSGSIIDRTWQVLNGTQARGDDIRLTIDAELCAYASSQFPQKRQGAIVVLNYKTGEVLAMVSKPDYDPAALSTRQSGADEQGSGYLNRVLQGQYSPGSTFKIVTLAAALEHIPSAVNREYVCEGAREFGSGRVTCYGGAVHGKMTLAQAFTKSCNITFASLAAELGDSALVATAKRLGFNVNFSFRDLVLYESSIPDVISDASELAWTGVGQGKVLVTPMHMALIASAVANEGVMPAPQLIKQVTGIGGLPRLRTASGSYGRVMSADIASFVGRYMQRVVAEGTGSKASIKGYTVCGKTGSAETSDDKSVPADAWFVGYIDDDSHPYAIAVIVEKGGSGGETAAPLAAKVLKKAISRGLSD